MLGPGQVLSEAGLKPTPNRILVLSALSGAGSPRSAHELFSNVVRKRPMNRVTVYRILDLLVERNLAVKSLAADGVHRYCPAGEDFHGDCCHFFCRRCGLSKCMPVSELNLDVEAIRGASPGRVENVEVRLDGICDGCRSGR